LGNLEGLPPQRLQESLGSPRSAARPTPRCRSSASGFAPYGVGELARGKHVARTRVRTAPPLCREALQDGRKDELCAGRILTEHHPAQAHVLQLLRNPMVAQLERDIARVLGDALFSLVDDGETAKEASAARANQMNPRRGTG